MSKKGEMDNQGFRAMFNYKVDNAKSKYRQPVKDDDREEKQKELRAKIISDVKEEFLKAVPEVINPFEDCIISSNWIGISGDGIRFYVGDVKFSSAELEYFFEGISMDLTAILGTTVQVDTDVSKFPSLKRFSVKV